MKCPACGHEMTEMQVGDIKVDACKNGCGGLWFDNWELGKVDEPSESAGEALLNIPRDPGVKVDQSQRLHCPRHPQLVMMRHFWSVKRQVTVDECPECRGVFLDPGELAAIRHDYDNDEERRKAADAYFGEMYDDKLAGMLAEDRESVDRAHAFARMFRFVCPSNYIPGKQKWGAF